MRELSILAAASEAPARECVIAEGRVWSFAQVAERVLGALSSLWKIGVQSGARVALTPQPDIDSVIWLYALFELGCPAVVLHPRLTDRERGVVLDGARPAHVITKTLPMVGPSDASLVGDTVPPERALAIVHTSGTRGAPRGAKLSRRAFVASEAGHAANLGWTAQDRWLLSMSPAHVGGLSVLTRCLIARRCVVLAPGPFDPARVIHSMSSHRVTLLSVVPTMLRRLLDCRDPAWIPNPELRAVLVGGASFSLALRQRATDRGVPVLATYGCTEACSQIATQALSQSGKPGSGAPLQGVEVRIQDGEIQVRGDTLMDGYLDEERSSDSWTSDGWLRTGDLGRFMADGQLLVRGRIDDLIVTGGENVAPQEVEAWLETVPGVTVACVFSMPSEVWGEEVVAALVVDSERYDPAVLRALVEEGLAPHKRPKRVCVLDALPLGRSGKIDRRELRVRCRQRLRPI